MPDRQYQTLIERLVCPLCRVALAPQPAALVCCRCRAEYSTASGFPSFLTGPVLAAACRREAEPSLRKWTEAQRTTERWRDEVRRRSGGDAHVCAAKKTQGHHVDPAIVEAFLQLRLVARDQALLDVGCGTAFRSGQFPHDEYVALDPSAVAAASGVPFVQAIAERMPLRSNSFGLVLCIDVLDHVITPGIALGEMIRTLASGGHLFLTVADRGADPARRHLPRQMFGLAEARAHLHTFDARFFHGSLERAFAEVIVRNANGFLFVHGRKKIAP